MNNHCKASVILLELWGLGFQAPTAFAQFTLTGPMSFARAGHSATQLPDGHVLIAGGFADPNHPTNPLTSAELYDPATETFAPTGSSKWGGTRTPTLLPDGRVLFTGEQRVEIYDPSTGTFGPGGAMTTSGCAATLLNDGTVLVVGDQDKNAEIYDPATGLFAPTPPYASNPIVDAYPLIWWDCPRAILLPDGIVLIASAVYAELYDPAAKTFSLTGTLPKGWVDPTRATLLFDGSVLFEGGSEEWGASYDTFVYYPASGTFDTAPGSFFPLEYNTITLLSDGTVFNTGGGSFPLDYTETRGGGASGLFGPSDNMVVGRYLHTATLLNNGKILVTGGVSLANPYGESSAELSPFPGSGPAPSLFSLSGAGQGQGAIWHGVTGQLVTPDNPAGAGEVLSMYAQYLAGQVSSTAIPPRVVVGGKLAEVLYSGPAPGYPGYQQVNFRTPAGITADASVPMRLSYLDRFSNEVTTSVQ
jgi:hypothetical protein